MSKKHYLSESNNWQGQNVFSNVFYLVLRRLRFPLILVIVVYAFCVLGMSFMPGVDEDGNRTPGMSLFDAFYVMSYTGTSIGLGELPHPYSGAQRLWMTLSIYMTVIVWTYSIFTVISLLQDAGFRNAVRTARLARKVRAMREPFYIVAGLGETGLLICHGLDRLHLRFVIIEKDQDRIHEVELEEFSFDPPLMVADASQASVLMEAGLGKSTCKGMMALAEDDEVNRSIAVAVRLLAPGVPVLSRVRNIEAEESAVGPFGGDIVINPFDQFAKHLIEAVDTPQRFRLRSALTGLPGSALPDAYHPPSGRWIVVGYGRFGRALVDQLRKIGVSVMVVDSNLADEDEVDVFGSGADESSLISADIEHADGLVAATDNDMTNLAIGVTARDLKPGIFLVTRQNKSGNDMLFDSFKDDFAMVPSRIVAQEFLAVITTPLVSRLLKAINSWDEFWCESVLEDLASLDEGRVPEVWSMSITMATAEPVVQALTRQRRTVRVGDLLRDPIDRKMRVSAKVLMIFRDGKDIYLPSDKALLRPGDHILFASASSVQRRVLNLVSNPNGFHYALTGQDISGGVVWKFFRKDDNTKIDTSLPQPNDLGLGHPVQMTLVQPAAKAAPLVSAVSAVMVTPRVSSQWEPLSSPDDDKKVPDVPHAGDELGQPDDVGVDTPWEPLAVDAKPPRVDPNLVVIDPDE